MSDFLPTMQKLWSHMLALKACEKPVAKESYVHAGNKPIRLPYTSKVTREVFCRHALALNTLLGALACMENSTSALPSRTRNRIHNSILMMKYHVITQMSGNPGSDQPSTRDMSRHPDQVSKPALENSKDYPRKRFLRPLIAEVSNISG